MTQTNDSFNSLSELDEMLAASENNIAKINESASQEKPVEQEPDIVPSEVNINVPVTSAPTNALEEQTDETPSDEEPSDFTAPTMEVYADDELSKLASEVEDLESVENVTLQMSRKEYLNSFKKNTNIRQQVDSLLSESFDINNISLTPANNSPIVVQKNFDIITKAAVNPAFPIIHLKSGYRAFMSALTNNEKIRVFHARGTAYDRTMALLRVVWEKMETTSIDNKKLSFDEFLDLTAEDDFQTTLFGIYYSTFPDPVTYTVKCPHCKADNKIKVRPDNLIEVVDQENASQYVSKVLEGHTRGRQFLSESMVAKKHRIQCPDSHIVFELQTNTLRHMLNSMQAFERYSKHYESDLINLIKYIAKCFVPNLEAFRAGKPEFFDHSDISKVLVVLDTLSKNDLNHLRKEIARMVRTYSIRYVIPSFSCASANCRKVIEKQDIDMVQILFLAIGEAMLQ